MVSHSTLIHSIQLHSSILSPSSHSSRPTPLIHSIISHSFPPWYPTPCPHPVWCPTPLIHRVPFHSSIVSTPFLHGIPLHALIQYDVPLHSSSSIATHSSLRPFVRRNVISLIFLGFGDYISSSK
uniref:Uncharacterized protein n=1 Tax=Cacopsylla melanoneura TaxID=428564 RepID=A0A8D9ACP7_9HEMI